ncbi:MAG: hydrogenase formation protein HypD [Candidatus Zixiibacteriota bacterium]|nr:MAG: hydrogenase formation protein HypD [candidate division Zixibacteria bacterium]
MKFIDEYRDPAAAGRFVGEIRRICTRFWTIMEVCGGQTHAIIKYGIDRLLPDAVTLLHGPGCPVCVTPVELVDRAVNIASRKDVIFCSFGDMLRVPGSGKDLLSVKAGGGDVRTVYSPLDALQIARDNPTRETVFFAIGFETTAPANAASLFQAMESGVENYSVLLAQVLIPPAMHYILDSTDCRVDGFLAPGHVCTVTGYREYEQLASDHNIPIVVTGFEPLDLLQGIYLLISQLESGRAVVENAYGRSVRPDGNPEAQKIMREVFVVVDRKWRGLGEIPRSGFALRDTFARFDAEKRFGLAHHEIEESPDCISGQILQGLKKPADCPAFSVTCTPEFPLGATMVSSEGVCAAYYHYGRAVLRRDLSGTGG